MLIYLDLLFILNFWIDTLLLAFTNIIIKYKISLKRMILSALIGSCATFLFLVENKIILFISKIIICIMMQLVMNRYKGIKTLLENTIYFYIYLI